MNAYLFRVIVPGLSGKSVESYKDKTKVLISVLISGTVHEYGSVLKVELIQNKMGFGGLS